MSEHIKNMADSCGQTAANESLATARGSVKDLRDLQGTVFYVCERPDHGSCSAGEKCAGT